MAVRPQEGNRVVTVEKTDEAGVYSGSRTEITSAHVRSVDLDRREVTLHVSDGKVEVVKAGPEVKNLEKLDRGDRVQMKFRGGLVLRRLAPGDAGAAPDVEKEVKDTGIGDVLCGGGDRARPLHRDRLRRGSGHAGLHDHGEGRKALLGEGWRERAPRLHQGRRPLRRDLLRRPGDLGGADLQAGG